MALFLVAGCAPRPLAPSPRDGQAVGAQRAPKILTLGIDRELDAWNTDLVRVTRAGGIQVLNSIGHNRLVVQTETFAWVPELALEQISFDRGTWELRPDNTMVTTWRLPRNAKWHDGTPFSSDDLLFTFGVMKDPEVPNTVGAALRVMRAASAPDPYTFVIEWATPYVDADQAPWLTPMPRHLLEEPYLRDKPTFPSHPWMTTDFVGLGPYRVARWERGSFMEFARFDDYFKGRPPLDGIVVRFVSDANAMIAAILAGQLDLIPAFNFDLDAALEVRRRWEGTENHVGANLSGRFATIETQHRLDLARPVNGLANASVRRAFYQALDRDEIAQSMTQGFGPAADSWFFPGHELRGQLETSIPRFPYNPARATQLLAESGWTRAADGILTNAAGEKFDARIAGTRDVQKLEGVIADSWRSIGARLDESLIGSDRLDDFEALSTLPGAWMGTQLFYNMYTDRFHSSGIAGPANRWTGRNRSGYNSPRLDSLLDRLVATVDPSARLVLHRELLDEQMNNLVVMPLYWLLNPFFVTGGVKGVGNATPWNLFNWDKE
jgi:peptide/nickel transport system substrate-binding protein